jgi:hypothetical protein
MSRGIQFSMQLTTMAPKESVLRAFLFFPIQVVAYYNNFRAN